MLHIDLRGFRTIEKSPLIRHQGHLVICDFLLKILDFGSKLVEL